MEIHNRLAKKFSAQSLAEYAATGVESVPGALQSGSVSVIWSILELQDVFGVAGPIAEIGVFKGKLFLLLCQGLNEGERAFAIDIFGQPPGSDQDMLTDFGKNLSRYGLDDGTVDIQTVDSSSLTGGDLTGRFGGQVIRLFSVDGDHGLEAVTHDLHLARQAICAGGIIIADDLFNPWYPTVTEAVYDFFKAEGKDGPDDLEPIALVAANGPVETGAAKLFIARYSHAAKYKAGLKLLNQADLKHCDPFAGFADIPTFYFDGPPQKHVLDDSMGQILEEIVTGL